jgi:hypothetical protein
MGIRFIDLREKLGCFAFYQTTVDRFLEYSGGQTWTRWESFERNFKGDPTTAGCSPEYLKAYCPDWVFEKRRGV